MSRYSEQDMKYAAELREEIHREALAVVRKTHPNVGEVVDRHPVEDYFQESWEYPGKRYTVVAVPYGYGSRKAFVDAIVRDTLAQAPEYTPLSKKPADHNQSSCDRANREDDIFSMLSADYPDLVVEYHIVDDVRYSGFESHRSALKAAYGKFGRGWQGDPDRANGKNILAEELFSPKCPRGKLNYRRAFLDPPHKNSYDDGDFARVNAALFPSGTDRLEAYEWDTDWSDFFDDGHEWWGALCLTVYDEALDRFVVITASATD